MMGGLIVCQRCEICNGEVREGVCVACGLPADDYMPDWDSGADETDEDLDDMVRQGWPPQGNPN